MTAVTVALCCPVAPGLYKNATQVVPYLLQRENTGILPKLAVLPVQELVGALGATVSDVSPLKHPRK